MGDIKAFLLPPVMEETRKVIITKRAKGPDGKPVPFVLRRIDQETNEKLVKRAQKQEKVNGQVVTTLDSQKFGRLLIEACVIEPDFKNSELCAHYETMNPLDVPERMLSSGEYARLLAEINNLNGFDEVNEVIEEKAKN